MEMAKKAQGTGAVCKKKRKTVVEAYIDPQIIIPIPSEERSRIYLMKHKELIGKSVRLSSVFRWYTNRQGKDYPPSVSSSLRLPPVNNDDIDIHAQKEAEEHGDKHGLADEEEEHGDDEHGLADEEVREEDENEDFNLQYYNFNGAI